VKIFYSKVDFIAWIVLAIIFISPIALFFAVSLPQNQNPDKFVDYIILIVLIPILLILFPCSYKFEKSFLVIKTGIATYVKISYSEIDSFKDSKSWDKAPAWSFDRIRINFKSTQKVFGFINQDSVLVSPKFKEEFVKELTEKIESLKNL